MGEPTKKGECRVERLRMLVANCAIAQFELRFKASFQGCAICVTHF